MEIMGWVADWRHNIRVKKYYKRNLRNTEKENILRFIGSVETLIKGYGRLKHYELELLRSAKNSVDKKSAENFIEHETAKKLSELTGIMKDLLNDSQSGMGNTNFPTQVQALFEYLFNHVSGLGKRIHSKNFSEILELLNELKKILEMVYRQL